MGWTVELHHLFAEEFRSFSEEVQDSLLAEIGLLERRGPQLGQPHADTLNASKHRNMKELHFVASGGV